MRRFIRTAMMAMLVLAARSFAATDLSIEGTQFSINGKPTFLLGISYYGALGGSEETIRRDLDDMQRYGFNWMRVWATWAFLDEDVSAVDGEGRAREPYLAKLRRLVEECDRRGMVVDVTLSRGGTRADKKGHLATVEGGNRAVETLIGALKSHRNWYLDLANERNLKDASYVSFEELAEMRKTAKALNSRLLITASHAGDIDRASLPGYLTTVQVDFIAPHRPRNAKSPGETAPKTREYFAMMKELGRTVPVHYQEPFRRSFTRGWEPTAEDFLADLKGAREGGAAGWCLHNGDALAAKDARPRRSFDLRDGRLFDQLDEVEKKFLQLLKEPTAADAPPSLPSGKALKLVWSDEFDGAAVDESKWEIMGAKGDMRRRDGFWVKDDAYLDGKGRLVLRTKKDGERYTCGSVRTLGKFEHAFGYYVARCQYPTQVGHWPAFWLHTGRMTRVGDEGRDGTEIDIMEKPWLEDRITINLHWDGYGKAHRTAGTKVEIPGVSKGFHTFGLLWTPEEYVFDVDGNEVWRSKAGGVSQVPEYIKLTEEIGTWAGKIAEAKLPDYFLIDYVRVYDLVDLGRK